MAQKNKKKSRRSAIVPRAVFAVALTIGSAPVLGCGGSRGDVASVAAPHDMGAAGDGASSDTGTAGDAARDGGGGVDFGFSVAMPLDMGPRDAGPDLFFSVALPFDGSFSVAAPLDGAFSVAALPDAFFSVAAPPPDAFFSVAVPADDGSA